MKHYPYREARYLLSEPPQLAALGPTCTEALCERGYTHRHYSRTGNTGYHEIVATRTGRVVARLTAHLDRTRKQRRVDAGLWRHRLAWAGEPCS